MRSKDDMSSTSEIRAVFRDLHLHDSDARKNLDRLSSLDSLHDEPKKPTPSSYSRSDTIRDC